MLYAGESDRKEGKDFPLFHLHTMSIFNKRFSASSRARHTLIHVLFPSKTHLNRADSSNSNSRKLFLSSLYFHIQNGTFDLGKFVSAFDTLRRRCRSSRCIYCSCFYIRTARWRGRLSFRAEDCIDRRCLPAGDFSWISSSEDRLIAGMKMEWTGERTWTLKLQLGLVSLITTTTTTIHRARFQCPLSHAIPQRQSRMGLGYPSLS